MAADDPTTFDPCSPEQWHPIPDLPGYEVSSHFRLRTRRRPVPPWGWSEEWYPVKTYLAKKGYTIFNARRDGRHAVIYLHHIVARLTLGPRPEWANVLHRDDDKQNNNPSNLYYGSMSQNVSDAIRNGKWTLGGMRTQAKLNDDDVREIRRLLADGVFQDVIGQRFGVSQSLVSLIARGTRWTHVV